jgi:hypothetical protein
MHKNCVYSTNVYLKYHLQQRFYNDIHYVWCSEHFDSKVVGAYSPAALVPPSSNPADIYNDLKEAVRNGDNHNAKINQQKTSIKALAIQFNSAGRISDDIKDEIIYMVDNSPFNMWRPLIYIIPRTPVEARMRVVPIHERASFGIEYIIEDIHTIDFDVIEL